MRASYAGRLGSMGELRIDLTGADGLGVDVLGERIVLDGRSGSLSLLLGGGASLVADGFVSGVTIGGEPAGELSAGGSYPLAADGPLGGGPLVVSVSGGRFETPMLRAIASLAPGDRLVSMLDASRPRGGFDARAEVSPASGGSVMAFGPLSVPAPGVRGRFEPRTLAYDPPGGGELAVRAFEGGVDFTLDGARVDLRARTDTWGGRVDGVLDIHADEQVSISYRVDGASDIPPDIVAALPAGVGRALKAIGLGGSGRLESLTGTFSVGRRDGVGSVAATGTFDVEDLGLTAGVEISEFSGEIAYTFEARSGAPASYGVEVTADHLRLGGIRATDARLSIGQGVDGRTVVIAPVEATTHGGRLAGDIVVRPEASGEARYEADLRLAGVLIAPLLEDLTRTRVEGPGVAAVGEEPGIDLSRGVLDGRVSLHGVASPGRPPRVRGRGWAITRDGSLFQLPFIVPILEASSLTLPRSGSLGSGEASFHFDERRATFDRILLATPAIRVYAYGTMASGTQEMDMRVHVAAIEGIPLLQPFLEDLRDEFVTVKVTGTPGNPNFAAEHFRLTRSLLGELLGRLPSEEDVILDRVRTEARRARPSTGGKPADAPIRGMGPEEGTP